MTARRLLRGLSNFQDTARSLVPTAKANPLIGVIGGFPERLFVIVRWMITAQLWKQALVAMVLAPFVGFPAGGNGLR